MKPNKTVIRQWIDALKSGHYPQGKFQLKTSDGDYCCWGVLCEISVSKKWSHSDAFPPMEVYNWAGVKGEACCSFHDHPGLSGKEPSINVPEELLQRVEERLPDEPMPNAEYWRLSDFNDLGVPFDLIADIIAHNWLEEDEE